MVFFSIVEYTAGAAQDTFTITFTLLKEAHLRVFVDEVETFLFTISGTDMILDTPAVGGEIVRLQRITPRTKATYLTTYVDGTGLTAKDLDQDRDQALFIMQEILDVLDGATFEAGGGGGTGGTGVPSPTAIDDFLVADAIGEAGWAVHTRLAAKAVLKVIPDATAVDEFLIASASGEDKWVPTSLADTKTKLGVGGGGGGSGFLQLLRPGPANTVGENSDIDDGFLAPVFGCTTLSHIVRRECAVPSDFDVTQPFTLNFLLHCNTAPSDWSFDVRIFALKEGTVNSGAEPAADHTPVLSGVSGDLTLNETHFKTVAVTPGASLTGAKALWFSISMTGGGHAVDLFFANAWITY